MSNFITGEGMEKLKSECREIKEVKLKEVAQRIKEAKDLGDLSENAEYHEAKNEQSFLYGKLLDLEKKIREAQIIVKSAGNGIISVGSCVMVENDGEKLNFDIVGSSESDPLGGKISIDSPLGSNLSGHKKGDIVVVSAPSGQIKYKIISVS